MIEQIQLNVTSVCGLLEARMRELSDGLPAGTRCPASFLPDREHYTRWWGPFLESLGVALGLGLLVALFAYRAWPAGTREITGIILQWEFLEDPALLAGIFAVAYFPSLIWVLLHPWIDARRIDRNPMLEHRIRREPRRFFVASVVMHALAFLTAVVLGTQPIRGIPSTFQMPLALAGYALVHGILHWARNRREFVYSRQSNINLQSHLYALMRADRARFQQTIQLLGAVSAFQNRAVDRIGLILSGSEYVSAEGLIKGLDPLIHNFPPRGGLESILKLGTAEDFIRYQPIVDEVLSVLRSKSAVSVGSTPDNHLPRLFSGVRRQPPLRVVCACQHNHNRSPAMEAALNALLEQKNLTQSVKVVSGGIAPIAKPSGQLAAALKRRGIGGTLPRPQAVTDDALKNAHLVLAADVPTAFALALRLQRLDPSPQAADKIVLFTSLDPARFHGKDNLPDPYGDKVTIREVLDAVSEVMEQALLPVVATATIPDSMIELAGKLMKGFFPGDLPPYQREKRMRLVLAIARNDPRYLIHIDRNNYRTHELGPGDLNYIWNDRKSFNELFLAQLCDRASDRKPILDRGPSGKDYSHSMMALHSLLSPVLHRITKSRQDVRS
jgi:protein-tyrosine-phosphatase